MPIRQIVKIDEEKCTGCGLCLPSCAEGALAIVDGKARLVKEIYCDGLGACLGKCPEDAITIEQREADAFDEEETAKHLARAETAAQEDPETRAHAAQQLPRETPVVCHGKPDKLAATGVSPVLRGKHGRDAHCTHQSNNGRSLELQQRASPNAVPAAAPARDSCGCPGATPRKLDGPADARPVDSPFSGASAQSRLGHWPVQISLLPPSGDLWNNADVLVCADCVPFAMPDFHERLLAGKTVAVGCPKLDNLDAYVDRLAAVFAGNAVRSVTVAHMEVPCCTGLLTATREALGRAGKCDVEFHEVTVGIKGRILPEISAKETPSVKPRIGNITHT